MNDNNNSPEFIDGDLFNIKDFELFYCRPNEIDFECNIPLIEYPIHHRHFRILSRILLVKIGMYENIENLELLTGSKPDLDVDDDYPMESIDLFTLESWESKILFYSSKLFFNELSTKEIDELKFDFDWIKNSCNSMWKRWVSYDTIEPLIISSDPDNSVQKLVWDRKRKIIKKKYNLWKQYWVKVFYDKEKQKFFRKFHGFTWDYKECVHLDRSPLKRRIVNRNE